MLRNTFFVVVITIGFIANIAYAQQPPEKVWHRIYDSGDTDVPTGIAVDRAGYVYVTGYSDNGKNHDFRTIKYDSAGNIVWNRVYDSGSSERAYGVAVDDDGNVYVTGFLYNGTGNFCTIKYDKDGNIVWRKVCDSTSHEGARGIAVDRAGYVYVAGMSNVGEDQDIRTIKYDKDGNVVWNSLYDGGSDEYVHGIAVDNAGNVYVTGCLWNGIGCDYQTVKFDKDGNVVWQRIHDSGGCLHYEDAQGVAVDFAGNVYVTGFAEEETDKDEAYFRTIKYDKDGNVVWNKLFDSGFFDKGFGIAVDNTGNVYETGYSYNGKDYDFRTIKYDKDGNVIWSRLYGTGENDYSSGVAVDDKGYVYVTGYMYNGSDWDFYTIKYRQSQLWGVEEERNVEDIAVVGKNNRVVVTYSLKSASMVDISVLNVLGSVVERVNGYETAGEHSYTFDVPFSGVYFVKINMGNRTEIRKVVITH